MPQHLHPTCSRKAEDMGFDHHPPLDSIVLHNGIGLAVVELDHTWGYRVHPPGEC